jgi:hypothetical protein
MRHSFAFNSYEKYAYFVEIKIVEKIQDGKSIENFDLNRHFGFFKDFFQNTCVFRTSMDHNFQWNYNFVPPYWIVLPFLTHLTKNYLISCY